MIDRVLRVVRQWPCSLVMAAGAVGVIYYFDLSFWTVLIVALLLACPAIIVWGAIQVKRQQKR